MVLMVAHGDCPCRYIFWLPVVLLHVVVAIRMECVLSYRYFLHWVDPAGLVL
jgi:hypothetical protein